MHPNAQLIARFYEAFGRLDAETMAACYHPDVHFSDPVFPDLHGAQAGNMWRMLLGRSAGMEITVSGVEADDLNGKAHWEPIYAFGPSKRRVHNVVDARFEFKDGLILRHIDTFDTWSWSKQALGVTGWLIGWTPFFRARLQAEVARQLKKFEAGRAAT